MKPKFTDSARFRLGPYVPSHSTDIRKRFEDIRRAHKKNEAEATAKVIAHIERKARNG